MPRHARSTARERIESGLAVITGGAAPLSATPPAAPSGLLASSRKSWLSYWKSPVAKIVQEVHLPQLTRLWQLRDERERCYRALRKERIVKGSMGQPRRSPLWEAISGLDAEIRQLEDRFGLSPRAWLGLGVTLGEAARSLADLNDDLADDDEADDDEADDGPDLDDPRLLAMDGRARRVPPAALG